MINNEYYYENSFTVTCTQKSISILQEELDRNNYKCKICGNDLFIITFMEGTCICCKENMDNHKCGYEIAKHAYYKKPPVILEGSDEDE